MDRQGLRVVSGGQTGVDRAALDVALELGLSCGGWCPKGRRAEDGPIDARYPLRETSSSDYEVRTARNVRDSDGTLVLHRGAISGGTALTLEVARRQGRPLLSLELGGSGGIEAAREWLAAHAIAVLNVAGPRESTHPGIQEEAAVFLRAVLAGLLI